MGQAVCGPARAAQGWPLGPGGWQVTHLLLVKIVSSSQTSEIKLKVNCSAYQQSTQFVLPGNFTAMVVDYASPRREACHECCKTHPGSVRFFTAGRIGVCRSSRSKDEASS